MRTVGLGLSFNVLRRRCGETALLRSIYGAGGTARDLAGTQRSKVLAVGELCGGWLLLPAGVPAWAHDRERLWRELGAAERQYDAQEGRCLDLQIPREIPTDLYEDLARFLYAGYVADGLPVQVDLHIKPACDGLPNPHLHALIGGRPIGPDGFLRTKVSVRHWNSMFRTRASGGVRHYVAERLNSFLARHEIAVQVDPRPNDARGLPPAEDRLPRSFLRRPGTVAARAAIAERDRQRALRHAWNDAQARIDEASAEVETWTGLIEAERAKLLTFTPADVGRLDAPDRLRACTRWADDHAVTAEDLGFAIAVQPSCESWCIYIEAGQALIEGDCEPETVDLTALFDALGWQEISVMAPEITLAKHFQEQIWRRGGTPDDGGDFPVPPPRVVPFDPRGGALWDQFISATNARTDAVLAPWLSGRSGTTPSTPDQDDDDLPLRPP